MSTKVLIDLHKKIEARRGTWTEFCLDRKCMTCGCWEVREELFVCLVQELAIDPIETGTHPNFRSIYNMGTLDLLQSAIYYFCDCLNELTAEETLRLGGMDNYRIFPRQPRESLIFFVVMEVWDALGRIYENRNQALATFLRRIENPTVTRLIAAMDYHYEIGQRRRYPHSQR